MATMRYFHSDISGYEAEELLNPCKNGRFLVRPSSNSPGHYSLSIKNNGEVIHVRIRKENGYYDLHGGERFKTLAELIQFYIENPAELSSITKGTVTKLCKLLPYNGVPTERWFHGEITEREAEFLLMTKAPIGGYLVQFSFHSPGNYVLSARTSESDVVHVLIVYQNKRFGIVGGPQFVTITDFIEYHKKNPHIESSGKVIELKYPLNCSSVLPQLIRLHGNELQKPVNSTGKTGFADELERINAINLSDHFSTIEADKLENWSKNRFKEIVPFDHTRVSLGSDGTGGNTYINASWINGEVPGSEFAYIAAQSHLPGTLDDFWYMAWQEKCLVIVMLEDVGGAEDYRYWPTPEDPGFYGPIQVVSLEETAFSYFTVRHFLVCHEYENEEDEQHTFQFHLHQWPENADDSIKIRDLYKFAKEIRKKIAELIQSNMQPGPTLVHCSAGVGRTGVFILNDILDNVIDRQKMEQEIDIRHAVESANEQRQGMLQTEEQYKILYQLLACHVEDDS